ncbi:helix-hairpin-helix domain-containing protein [Solidesulfovibrio magneticus]|uniref:RecD helicase-like helix-hairpin-helix domain-containing protein n=1 Tax=Solidesulfovibrio magneticus (strain ATCC 700980 / DSM 13731 / RS-1) TaxID=573370 RepID=C4XPU0_SOLM1|nr:helix-hairpin-helix domain-containing protein [Solidesulfovibrio magneticus]BAH77640.1 hypothetical protein DMR_41490 [Solidesulfovibrio magneticus RS-1]
MPRIWLIKGIGPVMAKRIVKLFGEATLDVIEADIQKLIDVSGVGSKRVGMIGQAWEEQKGLKGPLKITSLVAKRDFKLRGYGFRKICF